MYTSRFHARRTEDKHVQCATHLLHTRICLAGALHILPRSHVHNLRICSCAAYIADHAVGDFGCGGIHIRKSRAGSRSCRTAQARRECEQHGACVHVLAKQTPRDMARQYVKNMARVYQGVQQRPSPAWSTSHAVPRRYEILRNFHFRHLSPHVNALPGARTCTLQTRRSRERQAPVWLEDSPATTREGSASVSELDVVVAVVVVANDVSTVPHLCRSW